MILILATPGDQRTAHTELIHLEGTPNVCAERPVCSRLTGPAQIARDAPKGSYRVPCERRAVTICDETSVCLASALFDWCVFATGGWQPEAVTAYLLKAATLFERLA